MLSYTELSGLMPSFAISFFQLAALSWALFGGLPLLWALTAVRSYGYSKRLYGALIYWHLIGGPWIAGLALFNMLSFYGLVMIKL